MNATQLLLIVMRWAHGLATVVWLGGGAYATLILRPQLREGADAATVAQLGRATGAEFGCWVKGATVVFIVTGVILTFDRLASRGATVQYGVVLAVKVALALWMFAIAQGLGRRRRASASGGRWATISRALGSPLTLLWLGAVVMLLAAILKTLYETQLAGQ